MFSYNKSSYKLNLILKYFSLLIKNDIDHTYNIEFNKYKILANYRFKNLEFYILQ